MPLVVHSLWRAPDGALGLVLTNWGDEVQPMELEVPLAKYQPGADHAQIRDLTTGKEWTAEVKDGQFHLRLEMTPRSARVLEMGTR